MPTTFDEPDEGMPRLWDAATVEAAEEARCAAMIAGDQGALGNLLADDAIWTHSSGQTDDRQAFIGKIVSGASRYLTIERSDAGVRCYGEMAVSHGIVTMSALANGEPRTMRNRYLNVWISCDGQPKLVAAQSTKIA